MPILRYAEVLVTRAEAPLYQLADFPDKASLRDQILVERGWEFFTEGLRRQDLIRHGKFISSAQERGKSLAQDHHVLFPIPQQDLDANPALIQNPGY